MYRHQISRRELLRMGLGAAAGAVVLPRALSALSTRLLPADGAPVNNLDAALKAAKWIQRSRIVTHNGVTWPTDPLKPTSVGLDLYNGMPGVILFHIELYDATGDKSWLDDARLGANELIAQLPALQQAGRCGLYDGLAGAGFVLEETHRATGDAAYRTAATQVVGMIQSMAKKSPSGAQWSGPSAKYDIVSGGAGIGLFLLWVDRQMDDPASRTLALLAGRYLADVGAQTPGIGGTKWPIGPDDTTTLYPNFAHGTAGIGYFLAKLYRAALDRGSYAAALSAAQYIESIADTKDGGFKLFDHEPGGENVYYMGWANGPAGTSRLFQQLSQVTGRKKWGDIVDRCAHTEIANALPAKGTPGYWNNVSQAYGNAGIGEFFITLQRNKATPAYADMIQRLSADTLARATADGDALKWVQSVDRASPTETVAQTGFMQGAAGIGTFFLHADALAKGRKPAVEWPDAAMSDQCITETKSALDMSNIAGGPVKVC